MSDESPKGLTLWDIPASWTWTKAGEIATVIGGGTPRTDDPSNFENGTIPWITPADLSGYTAKRISHGSRNITEAGLSSSGATMMPAGSVLFSSRAPIGYVAIASNPVSTNQGFKSFVPQSGISSDYLYYYLQFARPIAKELASGTTFLEISGAKAALIPVPLAPAREQAAIVAEIEKQFTRLDAATAALKQAQANLKRYRASVLKSACEGRLVPTEAELARKEGRDYEPADKLLERILRERRARWEADTLVKMQASGKPPKDDRWKRNYREPTAPNTTSLPDLPEGWCWTRIGYAFDCIVPNRDKPESFTGDIPWLTLPDFGVDIEIDGSRDGIGLSAVEVERYNAKVIPAGSVVMSCVGRFGITAVIKRPSVVNQQLHAFVLPTWVSGKYSAYALRCQSEFMRSLSTATTIAYLNKENCNSVPVPLPPLKEQERIAAELDRIMSIIRALETQLELGAKRCERLKRSVLESAFSGQLVPQAPTDEPASFLLERIRAERIGFGTKPSIRRRRKELAHA